MSDAAVSGAGTARATAGALFAAPQLDARQEAGGTWPLRSAVPLGGYPPSVLASLRRWAEADPDGEAQCASLAALDRLVLHVSGRPETSHARLRRGRAEDLLHQLVVRDIGLSAIACAWALTAVTAAWTASR